MRASITRLLQFFLDNSLLLAIGAGIGLAWANLHPQSYAQATPQLTFFVNDVGMVFFFALMTKEVFEATLPGGPLASWRAGAVPVFAAIGGMAMPALIYATATLVLGRHDLVRGWAIPCATDIAFAYLAARRIFPRAHPAVPFLLLLAIADDALGLVVLAICYPTGTLSPLVLAGGVIAAVAAAWTLRRIGVSSPWWYVLGAGTISWVALHEGGLHPALALVPIVPFMPHAHPHSAEPGDRHSPTRVATLHAFEEWWRTPVQVVLLLFGLVNAGVPLASVGTVTGVVLISLVLGKPAGIVGATFIAERFGFRRSEGLDYRSLWTLGIAAGIGFTVALFFATAAFPSGELLDHAKMGALLSIVAFPIAIGVGRVFRAGNANGTRNAERGTRNR